MATITEKIANLDVTLISGKRKPDDVKKSSRPIKTSKIRGHLPIKTAFAVARILSLNPEESEIGWVEARRAIEIQGEDWIPFLVNRLGGQDSEKGKALIDWISSNREADKAAKAGALKPKRTAQQAQLRVVTKAIQELEKLQVQVPDSLRQTKMALLAEIGQYDHFENQP